MGCVGDAYTFDPVVLGDRECDAWVHYYRREWAPFLRDSLGLVSEGFGLGPRRTLVGAWLVLRANQVWAPYPDNDADAAREYMRRFYALVVADGSLDLDPVEAARSEVQWWHLHRVHQRENDVTETQLVDAVAHLYGYVLRRAGGDRARGGAVAGRRDGSLRHLGRRGLLADGPDAGGGAPHTHRLVLRPPRCHRRAGPGGDPAHRLRLLGERVDGA
jgi:hypothetical protein